MNAVDQTATIQKLRQELEEERDNCVQLNSEKKRFLSEISDKENKINSLTTKKKKSEEELQNKIKELEELLKGKVNLPQGATIVIGSDQSSSSVPRNHLFFYYF